MAIIEFHRGEHSQEDQTMETCHSVPMLEPRHPLETREGVLVLEQKPLPVFPDVEIVKITTRHQPALDTPDGTYYERHLKFSDGTRRKEFVGISRHPVSAVPVGKKPAWWTEEEAGFNKETTDKLHRLGRHTITGGIASNRAHSLYRNAWDMHLALDQTGEDFAEELQTAVIDLEGDSNGAMEGTGIIAYGNQFERAVRDAYLVDPCIVRQIGMIDVKKFVRHPEYFAREIFCLGKQAVRLACDEEENALKYQGTIGTSRDFFIGNLLLVRGLFWGEFGHVLAHVPEGQRAHYQLFEFSIANQKRELLSILRGSTGLARQGISTATVPGTHLSIANPRTIKGKVAYIGSIEERAAA